MGSIPILATKKVAPSAAFTVLRDTGPASGPRTEPQDGSRLLHAFLQEMGQLGQKYRPAELYDAGGDITKHWYVYYYFLDPITGKFERFKERFNINRQKTLEARRLWGEQAVKFMNRQLKGGYNPFEEAQLMEMTDLLPVPVPTRAVILPTAQVSDKPLPPLITSQEDNLITIQKVVDKLSKGATEDAKTTYKTMQTRWVKYAQAKGFDKLHVQEITTDHVKAFMEFLQHEKENAPKTINTTKAHLGQFWDVLKEDKLVSSNPFRSVKSISKRAARRFANKPKDRFTPPTTEELERIVQHLKNIDMRGLLRFVAMIYYEWVRPEEIVQLRVSNIDMKSKTITFTTNITKKRKDRDNSDRASYAEAAEGNGNRKIPETFFPFFARLPTRIKPNYSEECVQQCMATARKRQTGSFNEPLFA